MTREIPLMREFIASYRHPRVRLFRRNIINKPMQELMTGRVHMVKAGVKGQADVYAFVRASQPIYGQGGMLVGWSHNQGYAIPIEIEFKAERGRVADEQTNWRTFCQDWGVPHLILRASKEEGPFETVARWTRELNELVSTLGPC